MRNRILFVTHTLDYGGTEKALEELVVRLDRSQVEPIILCYGLNCYGELFNEKCNLGVQVVDNLVGNGFFSYWKTFRRYTPDVAMFVNGHLAIFPWYAYLAAKLAGARRIVGIEQLIADPGWPSQERRGMLEKLRTHAGWYARYRLKIRLQGIFSSVTVCVSDAVRNRLVNDYGFPVKNTIKIWNGANLSHFGVPTPAGKILRAKLNIGEGDPVIVCVARLIRHKGVHVLLEALVQVLKEFPSCKCLIVGDGPAKDVLLKRASELGLSTPVYFVGHQKDVRPYLEAANIFVLPSFKEGLPLSLVEAMAYGLPAVVTDVGGNSEAVTHGFNGFVVVPDSAEELADAIRDLFRNREKREEMGWNARARANEFDADMLMSRLKEVLLGKEHSASRQNSSN